MYMLDTNIVVDIFRGNIKTMEKLPFFDEFVISAVVFGELVYGAENSQKKEKHFKQIIDFSNISNLIAVSEQTAIAYGKVKAQLKKAGKPIPENDVWIAAHAIETNSVLVTKDQHFSVVSGLNLHLISEI